MSQDSTAPDGAWAVARLLAGAPVDDIDTGALPNPWVSVIQAIAQASQLWNGGAGLDAILVAGGGALLLGPYLKAHFRHARIVSEPVFANAEGYWKLAQRLSSGAN